LAGNLYAALFSLGLVIGHTSVAVRVVDHSPHLWFAHHGRVWRRRDAIVEQCFVSMPLPLFSCAPASVCGLFYGAWQALLLLVVR
jgi:hypothetical protein